jgi:adenylylsulfate kinase|tara:strand:- start:579 stop:1025 length:447 start_codon:yes stop_codon:yes gene_type:complete
MKILIMGLPGSGKSTLAKPLASLLGGVWLNADDVRKRYDDWDFSSKGRFRQAQRMKHLSDGIVMAGRVAVADFVCPTYITRLEFNPDFTVWMDTISRGRFEDTNDMFETPENVDYHVEKWFTNTPDVLHRVVQRYVAIKDGKKWEGEL